MKIAIANPVFGKVEVREVAFVPRVGDHVDLWYRPLPSVRQVIAFPSADSLAAMRIAEPVDAVVLVE